jgi:hypothetical protein
LQAFFTNPDLQTHKNAVLGKVRSYLDEQTSDKNDKWAQLGDSLAMKFSRQIVDNIVYKEDYVFFSITKIRVNGLEKNVGFGIFGNVSLKDDFDTQDFKEVLNQDETDKNLLSEVETEVEKNNVAPLSNALDIIDNTKIYNLNNFQIKYKDGTKLDWGHVYDFVIKSDEHGFNVWRLPTIDELKEIYSLRQNLGINSGIFWSSTLSTPDRMGLIVCINFANGEELLCNEGDRSYLLIMRAK